MAPTAMRPLCLVYYLSKGGEATERAQPCVRVRLKALTGGAGRLMVEAGTWTHLTASFKHNGGVAMIDEGALGEQLVSALCRLKASRS